MLLLEITRNWESFSVELASQEWISRSAAFRMNYWMFGNSDSPIGALSEGLLDNPEANQTFENEQSLLVNKLLCDDCLESDRRGSNS
jgi:hypothetical protein